MKKLLENVSVCIEESALGCRASATVDGIKYSEDSTRDYAAVAAVIEDVKKAALEALKK